MSSAPDASHHVWKPSRDQHLPLPDDGHERLAAYIRRETPQRRSALTIDGWTKYPEDAFRCAAIYKRLSANIDSYHGLALHLETTPAVAHQLGFDDTPSHDTFRYFEREILAEHGYNAAEKPISVQTPSGDAHTIERQARLDDHAEAIAEYIVETGDGDNCPLAEAWLPQPEFDFTMVDSESVLEVAAKDRAYEKVAPVLYDVIDFERAENTRIEHESLIDLTGYLAVQGEAPEQGRHRYFEQQDRETVFSSEAYRRAVRNKERHLTKQHRGRAKYVPPTDWSIDEQSGDTWHATTERGIERLLDILRDNGQLDDPVPVCIDGSIRPWHKHPEGADERPDGVYQEAYFETNYGWKDLSATAIVDGRAVVLANLSMVPGDSFFTAVKYLIDRACDLVDVECFYADAEFANTDICRYIGHIGEQYVMKKPHRSRVKNHLEEFAGKADYTEFEMRSPRKGMSHNTTLFAVEKRGQIGVKRGETRHEDHHQAGLDDFDMQAEGQLTFGDLATEEDVEYVAFVTNRPTDSVGIDPKANPIGHGNEATVWGHAERYRRRWSIETAFRQVKYDFLAKTRSRDLGARRFYWSVALLLYNSWAILNILVQSYVKRPDDRPPEPAGLFLDRLTGRWPPP